MNTEAVSLSTKKARPEKVIKLIKSFLQQETSVLEAQRRSGFVHHVTI